ncbi:MAG: methionine--tRNA ligase [Planctomycetes bacterium]|nr:methionine--tRNA ligase [Planctomycetota bacterium]
MAKFYITTPIYYVNAEPHIGTAYTTIAGDVLARYHRMKGDEVFYLTGTDEHGQKIARTAKEKGITPKELVDTLVPKYQEVWQMLNITNDGFIRTTDPKHEAAVQALFRKISLSGDIYKGKYAGWYCVPCERYLLKDELKEQAGVATPLCPICKRPAEHTEETNYFFRLSKYQNKLLEHFKAHPDFVLPKSRYNEIIYRLETGIDDISISRSAFDWGVNMPDDPTQVIWVWFDALINYISAIGYPADEKQFRKLWPAEIHLIAKDILWFHTVIWPAMLFSAGVEPPKQVFAHGWWTMNSEKISKSKGNVVYPQDVVDKFGVDGVRYFLLREVPFGLDGDFSYPALMGRYNNDLGNDLGNLLLRTLTMIEKYFQGEIPYMPDAADSKELREMLEGLKVSVDKELGKLQFSAALERIWEVVKRANKFIEETKPWSLAKQNPERLKPVLYTLVETIRIIAVWISPFMPGTADAILLQLGIGDGKSDGFKTPPHLQIPKALEWGQVKGKVSKSKPLFPRIEDK